MCIETEWTRDLCIKHDVVFVADNSAYTEPQMETRVDAELLIKTGFEINVISCFSTFPLPFNFEVSFNHPHLERRERQKIPLQLQTVQTKRTKSL